MLTSPLRMSLMLRRSRPRGLSRAWIASHAIRPASAAKAPAASIAWRRISIIGANASSTGKRAPMIQFVVDRCLYE